jgi:hypothetical protein
MFLKLANPIYFLKNGKEWCNTGEIERERFRPDLSIKAGRDPTKLVKQKKNKQTNKQTKGTQKKKQTVEPEARQKKRKRFVSPERLMRKKKRQKKREIFISERKS